MLTGLVEAGLLAVGAFFLFVSALGLWRLGDFFERIHAPTKAATLGLISIFGATLLSLGGEVAAKVFAAILFVGATAPVGAHYLARTAYRAGLRPRGIRRDDYRGEARRGERAPGDGGP